MTSHRRLLTLYAIGTALACGEGADDDASPSQAAPQAPEVVILSPDGTDRYTDDAAITLDGLATDDDSPLESLAFRWVSDVSGLLLEGNLDSNGNGKGEVIISATGRHTLEFQVEDPDGLVALASVAIQVESGNTRPELELDNLDDLDELTEGDGVTIKGAVSDGEDSLENLEVVWELDDKEINGNGPTTVGVISVELEDLEAGFHTLSVTVTDSGGLYSSTRVDFNVDTCADDDRDGYKVCGGTADCDDDDKDVNPGATEECDGKDNDCNGREDEGFPDTDGDAVRDCIDECPDDSKNDQDNDDVCGDVDNCPTKSNSDQKDSDDDGLGDACDREESEICDGSDNDNDGNIDEGFDTDSDDDGDLDCVDECPNDADNDIDDDTVCGDEDNCPTLANTNQADRDGDGEGDACDTELCNGLDDDRDGQVDEDFDIDGDNYVSCSVLGAPADCDDTDLGVNPGVAEVCGDTKDNDCDGQSDENTDKDGDGFGTCSGQGVETDCNDNNPSVKPGATETCDGVDQDCDDIIDDGLIVEDGWEPNDDRISATSLGDRNNMTFSISGTIHEAGDVDWFTIEVLDDFAVGFDDFFLNVTLSGLAPGVQADLYLYWDEDDDPGPITTSTNPTNGDEYVEVFGQSGPENGGTYVIEVRSLSGFSCAPYTLNIANDG